MIQQYIVNNFLKQLENISYGSINLTTPDNKEYFFGQDNQLKASLHIKNWSFLSSLVTKGDVGFARSYQDGHFLTDSITNLCKIALLNSQKLDKYLYGRSLSSFVAQIIYFCQSNSIKGSRKNILAHYDLGNDFYSLWLDPSMTYSSGIFHDANDDLTTAQNNKYDRIISLLAKPEGNLLEIGCGWGGFVQRALSACPNLKIKGITLSDEQHQYAKHTLDGKATIALEDYRSQEGKYDNIVSIEMFEAVGEKYWPKYFQQIKNLLSKDGKAIIQTITIADDYFQRYRKGSDIFRSFIFPGGMLPSKTRLKEEVAKAGLQIQYDYSFGQDYAKTTNLWLSNFEEKIEEVKQLGFEEKFIRMWQLYLGACTASFSTNRTNVMQMELIHA